MFAWLAANAGYIVVSLVLILIVCAILVRMGKSHRSGKSGGCGSDCAGCPNACNCHPAAQQK